MHADAMMGRAGSAGGGVMGWMSRLVQSADKLNVEQSLRSALVGIAQEVRTSAQLR